MIEKSEWRGRSPSISYNIKWQSGTTKFLLCAGSGEGSDHLDLLYAVFFFFFFFAIGCFHDTNP